MVKGTSTLHNIQVLRAFAALLVVMHHAYPHYKAMGGDVYSVQFISEWGFIGVDIFFVISGFIMAYTTFEKERGFKNATLFLKHRLLRIYLGYWPFFMAMLVLLFITNPSHLKSLDIVGSFFLLNVNMFELILPVSWSLSYELYFYFLFLFTFFLTVKQLRIVVPMVILLLLLAAIYTHNNPTMTEPFFYSHFLLEFFLGVILYAYKRYFLKNWILVVAPIIIVFCIWYGITHETKNGLYRILTFGTASFFMILSALILESKNIYAKNVYFESLGNASYTLYLSHLIILQLFYFSGLRNVFTSSNSTVLPLLGFLCIFALCIIFSLIYYKRIEKPMYQKAIQFKRAV